MATGGYGRGGRGAALLQALRQPSRKPGAQQDEEAREQSSPAPATVQPATVPHPAAVPMGRGAYLAGLLQGMPTTVQPVTSSATASSVVSEPRVPSVPQMPMGRGRAAMQALLQSSAQHLPLMARGQPVMARGQLSIQQQAPSQVKQFPPSAVAEQAKPPSPPTEDMGRLGLHKRSPSEISEPSPIQHRAPTVSKTGSSGKPMALSANSIRILCKNAAVYQYHVTYTPHIDSKAMRFGMLNEHRNVIGPTKAFDGSVLFLPIKLPNVETILKSKRKTDNADISLCVKLIKAVKPEQCSQLYNIVFRRIMGILEMCQVGRYYYNPRTPSSVPQHKLEVWPGYISAIREEEGGLLLLLDASHRVLRTETVWDVMESAVRRSISGYQDEITRNVVGCIVLTRYNNKTYRIDDILWEENPCKTFKSAGTGEEISFLDYYKRSYNISIRDRDQPLLLHRPKKKRMPGEPEAKAEIICLIPELCYLTGLSDDQRKDFRLMKDIAVHTRVTPMQRQSAMKKFVDSISSNQEAYQQLSSWGLELDTNTVHIDGRQLPPEMIKVDQGRKKFSAGPEADFGREITRNPVLTAVNLRVWIVVSTKRDQSKAADFIQMMLKVCPSMGIDVHPPTRLELRDDRTESLIKTLRGSINPQIQMVVIICPTSRDDRYSAIKKLCCVECPVPSQVIIAKTISQQQKLRSVTQKIALQINCKLGGELWAVDIPLDNLMVVGIDVYHDATKGKRSIAGFVSSLNRTCTRWYSKVCFQLPHEELVNGLKVCLLAALRKYHEVNHKLPDRIIVYRDGVGDGQLSTAAGYEIKQLSGCFSHFENYEPKLTVVIVQKRINTRIFMKVGGNRIENPGPGTIVDHTVTRREWYDFFLVSQHVRQGTVSPTHFIVIYDSSGLGPDHMQRLAYKMTHLYYNWPGTVRVPAPCQYAHKLAYLVGQNIHKEPSEELTDKLFFL